MKKPDSSGRIFLRSMIVTLILIAAIVAVILGAAKAYTAIRKNAFGEQAQVFEVRQTSDGVSVKVFDWEGEF